MGHEERAHALLSASSAHRWMACTPSAVLEQGFPGTASDTAQEGTLAHELAELKLRNYFHTPDFNKRKLTGAINKLKKQELWKDEMLGYTEDYLDYIKAESLSCGKAPYVAIEKELDYGAYATEGFGTADCILISGDTVHVIDFKYGTGVPVSAEHNPQMMLYALGAYATYRMLYPISRVKLSIVQPRLPDGPSVWECSVEELLAFGDQVKEKAALAFHGQGDYAPGEKECRFCRAKGTCRARAEQNVRLAFQTAVNPPLITNAEVGEYLLQGRDIAKWVADLEDYALRECLAGREVPGWKAVEGRGSRAWIDTDAAIDTLKAKAGIKEEMLYETKPLTAPAVEKLMGKKDFAVYEAELVIKTPGKPTLAKAEDKRPAITNAVSPEEAFAESN